ncbi:MAG: UDP-2,3-diacylglucosamine diphosphatase [Planctomycetes bacterium]|nr:UDP-2,3-diacylglucosamine diphosphatase [Planctomycetota bacterium]
MITAPRRPQAPFWVLSDVHLYHGGDAYLEQFLDFLGRAVGEAKTLYIAGDLFEFWIGDRQGSLAFYRPLFERLGAASEAGLNLGIMQGNRDFLLGQRFAEAGCELLPDELILDLAGQRVHLSHGDQFCLEDRSYLRARTVMRSRPARAVAACLPASLGLLLARSYRGISERKKARKKMLTGNRFHTVERGVRSTLQDLDLDGLICGHIHWPRDQWLDVAGRRRRVITTGAWEEGPNLVVFDGKSLELRQFPALEGG